VSRVHALTGHLEITLAAILWGSDGVLVNLLPLSAQAITFLRLSLGGTVLFLAIVISKRSRALKVSKQYWLFPALGLTVAVSISSLFEAMKRLPISEAVLLSYTGPIFAALLALILLHEIFRRSTAIAILMGGVGVTLMILSRGEISFGFDTIGIFLGLISGFAFGMGIVLSKYTLGNSSSLTVSVYTYLSAALWLAPIVTLGKLIIPVESWVFIFIMGVVNTAFAQTIYLHGLSKVKAQEAAVLGYLEVPSAAFFGYVFLRQTLGPIAILGGALILAAGYTTVSR
jgi:drug/metabolite transporter (DMT)-like permease